MKKIILAAGTGFLGQAIIKQLEHEFDIFVVLTRGQNKTVGKVKYVNWDAENEGAWQSELENAIALINLTGKNVNCRYTKKNKEKIISSRVNSTAILGKTIAHLKSPPQIWINCASATIYNQSFDTEMVESSETFGQGFSVEVCKAWEKSFFNFNLTNTRMVCLRIGMIFGNGGGVFPILKKLTKIGLGGKMASGKQFVSWMDECDFVGLINWAINNNKVIGVYNCTAPYPITNSDYTNQLRKKMNVRIGLPANKWMLNIGAFFIRTEAELVLKSRNVIPQKAINEGFVFKFPKFIDCINHLIT